MQLWVPLLMSGRKDMLLHMQGMQFTRHWWPS